MNATLQLAPLRADAPTMSSLQIAEITGKEHRNIMIDIRRILTEAGIDGASFLASQNYGNNNSREVYNLPRRECDLVISGYSVRYRLAIIDRWQDLESKQSLEIAVVPSLPEMLRIAAAAMEENEALKLTVSAQSPKVEALHLLSISDGSTCIQRAAKTLNIHPLANLHKWMSEKKWIFRRGGEWIAHQDRIRSGHLEDKVNTVEKSDGSSRVCHQTLITPKGLAKLAEHFSRDFEMEAAR